MRKVHVNAQVKAMISLLETSSNIFYVVMLAIIVRRTFVTILQIMTLYLVLLPYLFLMNTSHNKERIVEHGWMNVLRNMFGSTPDSPKGNNKTSKVGDCEKLSLKRMKKHLEGKRAQKVFTTASSNTCPSPNSITSSSLPKHAWLHEESSTSRGYEATNGTLSSAVTLNVSKLPKDINKTDIFLRGFKKQSNRVRTFKDKSNIKKI